PGLRAARLPDRPGEPLAVRCRTPGRRPLARPAGRRAQASPGPGGDQGDRPGPLHGDRRRPGPLAHRERRPLPPAPRSGPRRSRGRPAGPGAHHDGRTPYSRPRVSRPAGGGLDTGRRALILSNDRSITTERMMVNLIDMTEMLRPFFWLMVGMAALAPVAIAVARRFGTPAS